jgi:outer membrane lipoprotein-sorting protein
MKNIGLFIGCFLLFFVWSVQAEEPPELQQILEQINTINTFSDVYTGMIQVASFAPDKDPVVNAYTTYVKGLDNILMIQKAPKKDAGKKILLKKDKIWFYFPKAKQALVINPRNTLLGTVSIGDVMSPPILELYEFSTSETVTVEGNETLKLEFVARTNRSPYGKMVYYYNDTRIVASESYARSGILLKKAFFEGFITNADGAEYASKVKIENGVNPEYYALIKISDLQEAESLPDYYFMIEGLDKINE